MLVSDDFSSRQGETHILHPASRLLFRFWETMRAERAAPRRDVLDLKQIRQLVPHLFIVEYAPRSRSFRWRLAGTSICNLYRRELTGADFLAGWDHFEADTIGRFLTGTIRDLQPCLMRFRFFTDHEQVIGTELAGFPITATDGQTTHILGGLFPFTDSPSMDYSSLTRFELSAARSIWTELLPSETPPMAVEPRIFRNFKVISGGLS